ncbi:hypothetical protein EV426DRAFT_629541 [Tirmania nivea]|nr:hypothetical protein EV426DRAFT_629541 [Tirmania nivea]
MTRLLFLNITLLNAMLVCVSMQILSVNTISYINMNVISKAYILIFSTLLLCSIIQPYT